MSSITKKVCEWLLLNKIIEEDDIPLYEFGLTQLFFYIIEYGALTLMAIMLGIFKFYTLFLISILSLRKNAGGIHSESHVICFIITNIIFFFVLEIIKVSAKFMMIKYLVIPLLFGIIVLIVLSPIETPNKPISRCEFIVFRRRVMTSLSVHIILLIFFFIRSWILCATTLMLSIILASVLVILGKIKLLCRDTV